MAPLPSARSATRVEVLSPAAVAGDLGAADVLDDVIGSVAFQTGRSLAGNVFHFSHQSGCSLKGFEGPGADETGDWFVLAELPSTCDARLPILAKELQARGAAGVFLSTQACLCDNVATFEAANSGECSTQPRKCSETLAPRGPLVFEPDVTIPVMVVSHLQAVKLLDCLNGSSRFLNASACGGERPRLQLSWSVPVVQQPELTLFSTSGEVFSPFKDAIFADLILPRIVNSLGDIQMFPQVLDNTKLPVECPEGSSCPTHVDCTDTSLDATLRAICAKACLVGGRFCSPDVDGLATGRQVTEENLRQVCLLQSLVGSEPSEGRVQAIQSWFRYGGAVRDDCLLKGDLTEECSKAKHSELGLDFGETSSCAAQEAIVLGEYEMTKEDLLRSDVVKFPSIALGRTIVPYDLSWGNTLSALCASYPVNSEITPEFCDCIVDPANPFQPRLDSAILSNCFLTIEEPEPTSSGIGAILGAVVGVFVVVGAAMYAKRVRQAAAEERLAGDLESGAIQPASNPAETESNVFKPPVATRKRAKRAPGDSADSDSDDE
eukprot:CAMPEP_0202075090 /NCGR_PEP_ID=MMETSP0964-20121228/4001_1 /ASSEMBLY_ACC=CAM_ASM_000500 /TAXON_ID=4773 /ORGANISM="Schizochytrium aggregatum, Strain ATCC28209" /LENGTH=549 /DNA_ID=CAMNT_0048642271 /DNA_START=36 /DNA_END=1685 /DNA_ORIENTATION=-